MNLRDLAPAGLAFVVVAITLSIGASVTQTMDLREGSVVQNTTVQDAYKNGTASLGELSSWLPTIALVLAAAVVIGVVVSYFAFKK